MITALCSQRDFKSSNIHFIPVLRPQTWKLCKIIQFCHLNLSFCHLSTCVSQFLCVNKEKMPGYSEEMGVTVSIISDIVVKFELALSKTLRYGPTRFCAHPKL